MGKEWQGPVGWLCWLHECLRGGYAEATRGRELESETRNAHLFQLFGLSQGSLQTYRWIPHHISKLTLATRNAYAKKIYENLIGSAEWLRMPTRCCKYHKFCLRRLCWSSLFNDSWQKKSRSWTRSKRYSQLSGAWLTLFMLGSIISTMYIIELSFFSKSTPPPPKKNNTFVILLRFVPKNCPHSGLKSQNSPTSRKPKLSCQHLGT